MVRLCSCYRCPAATRALAAAATDGASTAAKPPLALTRAFVPGGLRVLWRSGVVKELKNWLTDCSFQRGPTPQKNLAGNAVHTPQAAARLSHRFEEMLQGGGSCANPGIPLPHRQVNLAFAHVAACRNRIVRLQRIYCYCCPWGGVSSQQLQQTRSSWRPQQTKDPQRRCRRSWSASSN